MKFRHTLAAISIGMLLAVSSGTAAADSSYRANTDFRTQGDPTGPEMVVDLVAVRPLGLVATVGGVAAWIVSLPFTALAAGVSGNDFSNTTKQLVTEPARYTFRRPVGDFSY